MIKRPNRSKVIKTLLIYFSQTSPHNILGPVGITILATFHLHPSNPTYYFSGCVEIGPLLPHNQFLTKHEADHIIMLRFLQLSIEFRLLVCSVLVFWLTPFPVTWTLLPWCFNSSYSSNKRSSSESQPHSSLCVM